MLARPLISVTNSITKSVAHTEYIVLWSRQPLLFYHETSPDPSPSLASFPQCHLGLGFGQHLTLAYPGLPGHTLAYPGLPWPTSYLGLRWPTPAYPYHCPHWRTLPWPTLAYPIPWPTPTLAYTDIPWLTPYHGLHLCPGLPWPTLVYTIPWHSLAWPPHPGIRWPTPTLILAYPGLPHTLVHPDPAWPTLTYPDPGLPWPSLAYLG